MDHQFHILGRCSPDIRLARPLLKLSQEVCFIIRMLRRLRFLQPGDELLLCLSASRCLQMLQRVLQHLFQRVHRLHVFEHRDREFLQLRIVEHSEQIVEGEFTFIALMRPDDLRQRPAKFVTEILRPDMQLHLLPSFRLGEYSAQ